MSINNREDATKYYQLVNGLIDHYIDGHKIRPSRLGAYLKPGGQRFNKFLERNKLKDIKGIEVILKDVIEDRTHLEKDGVLTFENFKYFESDEFKINSMRECLYKAIDKSTLSQEKVLADYFDTNLSSIDVIDSHKHLFDVEDWEGDKKKVVIYSEEEVEVIKNNFIEFLFTEISERKIEIGTFEITISEFIDKKLFEEKLESKFTKNKLADLISDCLGEDWEFEGVSDSQHIWVKL